MYIFISLGMSLHIFALFAYSKGRQHSNQFQIAFCQHKTFQNSRQRRVFFVQKRSSLSCTTLWVAAWKELAWKSDWIQQVGTSGFIKRFPGGRSSKKIKYKNKKRCRFFKPQIIHSWSSDTLIFHLILNFSCEAKKS